MKIKGTDGQKWSFNLVFIKRSKVCEQTGLIFTKKPKLTSLPLDLRINNSLSQTSILISDVKQLIQWFKSLLTNEVTKNQILIYDKRLQFDLLENTSDFKRIKITHDNSIPVPGHGGYSLAPGLKYEDVFKKSCIEFQINKIELKNIIEELKNQLKNANRVVWK